ncbi:MAG: hypothetical protein RLZZ387_4552, partial [Chloroflexota bacterium]
ADQINLAAPLTDGQHIIVPRLGAASLALAEGSQAGQDGGLLDINTADPEALDALPGIGAAIAERIVAYREENGPFRAVEELQQVKGIGAALFEKIAPLVTVGP